MSTIKTNNVVDLGGNVLLAKGQAAKYVESMQDLLAANMESHKAVNVLNYHTGLEGGGGVFYWEASRAKTEHNGGTVIDPAKAFPTDWNNQTQLTTWFTAGSSGSGCWVRQYDGAVNVKWFGAKGDGITDDTKAIQKAHDSCFVRNFSDDILGLRWTAGNYSFTNLNLSPLVHNKAIGNVVLTSTILTGVGINISTEWGNWLDVGIQIPNSSNGQIFKGKFIYKNANAGSNSALGILFGRNLSTLGYSAENIVIEGMKLHGWGISHAFATSAYCINFVNCKFTDNGNHIYLYSTYIDNVERISYTNCTFANGTNVINGDTGFYGDYYFNNCSFDYNTRLLANVKGVALIHIHHSHLEWNPEQVLINVNGCSVTITDSYYFSPVDAAVANPVIATVTNGGYLIVRSNSYKTPTGANLYAIGDSTSRFSAEDDYRQFGGAENLYVNNYGGGKVNIVEASLSIAGYERARSGLITQWGTIPTTNIGANATAIVTVTFSKQFPTACTFATASMQPFGSTDCYGMTHRIITGTPLTTTQFAFRNGASAQDFINGSWMALGY